ncbi:DinB family protein [Micromonospora sp. PLK6-60]|uniref:DinB family protein n=1 Tax=Micromonospora sp. PLK6-60 TaxID=2873383 RepID=UPI001CA78D63|nr:DinB family protein [Micromonospora sp. PLK6-60]MBY8873548.1 DinB family protein [Micromonospora sp. PLK6-60]
MSEPPLGLLRWQFDLTWSLFEYHLERLEPADFLWEPATHCWSVRRGADGSWTPDWADTEPDPVPVPTIGWLTWHIGWWWTVTTDHLRKQPAPQRTDVRWPGAGEPAVAWLRHLRTEWRGLLDSLTDADLGGTAPFPWQGETGYTVTHTIGWVNAELMKNAAEIGQLRLLRASRTGPGRQTL